MDQFLLIRGPELEGRQDERNQLLKERLLLEPALGAEGRTEKLSAELISLANPHGPVCVLADPQTRISLDSRLQKLLALWMPCKQ